MTAAERGVLLLCAHLPDGEKPLTTTQFRTLSRRAHTIGSAGADPSRELQLSDFFRLGYTADEASRMLRLLSREDVLLHYLARAEQFGILPVTRLSPEYPQRLYHQLGLDCPSVLFVRGPLQMLQLPMIGVVGSRALRPENQVFAERAGELIAEEGYALVSGGAVGADTAAQRSCLQHDGCAVIFPATPLTGCRDHERTCFVSENGFDLPFSAPRALHRNRLIHAMAEKVIVAQSAHKTGGTWAGTTDNLRHDLSPVFVYDDKSEASQALCQLGAQPVSELSTLSALQPAQLHF